jgi:hypothetical protein
MADNLTAGNPRAHAVRVYYFGTSVIYEGMPVCYDNSTTNWFGGSVADTGEVTASTTTAEGSQNEGKYIRVENPNADNVSLFAGVVKRGGWVGTTGPSALDIYIPNGAIVPVRTDSNCLLDQTILAITTASQELGVPLGTDSRPVAISREEYDRGTAGLVLAELCPERFLFQDMGGTPLSVDDADTTTGTQINHSNIKFLGSSIYNRALYMVANLAGGGAGLNGVFKFRTYVSSTMTSLVQGICSNLHIQQGGNVIGSSGEYNSCFYGTIETESVVSGGFSGATVCVYQAVYYVDEGNCTAPTHAYVLGIPAGYGAGTYDFDGLFITGLTHVGDHAAEGSLTSTAAGDRMIPVRFGTTTYYLVAYADDDVT